jgi:hypothetical protein
LADSHCGWELQLEFLQQGNKPGQTWTPIFIYLFCGSIDPNMAPILSRIGARPEAWIDTISRFGSKFRLAAGRHINLKNFAQKIGVHWLLGVSTARASFF